MVVTETHQGQDPLGDLLDHEYDGIREYDNPCPGWWNWLFFATIVFALFYFFYFHIGRAGITIAKDHENAISNNVRLRFAEIGELTPDEPTLLKYMQQPQWLSVGQSVYEQKCRVCHGEGGCGLVGPNLTDEYYKSVDSLVDVITVISQGAGNGSMPAWKRLLHPNELLLVSAYVANMRGENLAGPRQAEGKEIPPWPAPEVGQEGTSDTGNDAPGKPDDLE
jgi:cytochrome c oxidase cbb3-type subunit 3